MADPSRAPRAPWVLAAAFAAAVSLLKVGQHYSFQTQAYDLGVFANVIWNTGQGRLFLKSFTGASYLGDHFSPLLALLVPLFWLWKSAAVLLVFQSLALAAAVPAVYMLAERITGDRRAALGFAALFALFPYVHRLSRYDFHDVSLAVPLVLWMLHAWETRRPRAFWLLFAAALLIREDLPLVLSGFGAYLALFEGRRWGWGLAAGCLGLLALETVVLMPRLAPDWKPAELCYAHLGRTLPEMVRSLLSPPVLWRNSLGDPERLKGLLALVAWTGGLCLAAPRQWVPLLIPIAYNMVSRNPAQYRFDLQYSATVLPFLFYAALHGYRVLAARMARAGLGPESALAGRGFFLVLLTLSALSLPRYFRPIPWERTRAALAIFRRIPAEDPVRAQNSLVPHLCFRRDVRLFPDPRPVPWTVLDLDHVGWHPPEDFIRDAARFVGENRSRVAAADQGFLLFEGI